MRVVIVGATGNVGTSLLDGFEPRHPEMRVVRMRPAFSFRREAATEQRRLFAGPLLPNRLVRSSLLPVVPGPAGPTFQAVHTDDVAEASRLALMKDVHGAFNIAAEPPLDLAQVARLLDAKPLSTPAWTVRGVLAAAWRMRLADAPGARRARALRRRDAAPADGHVPRTRGARLVAAA